MWKLCTTNRLIIANGFRRTGAYYSSKSKDFSNLLGILSREMLHKKNPLHEGGPNWELFNPKGNRFFLPNSMGLAWYNPQTVESNVEVEKLVDFKSQALDKFRFSCQPCPALIRTKVGAWFPSPTTIITLSYQQDTEEEYAARNFMLAATEICRRLQYDGYWTDFFNPFTGKPFFSSRTTIFDREANQFRFKYEKIDDCTVMTSTGGKQFSGIIFTTAPFKQVHMKRRITVDIPIKMLVDKHDAGRVSDDDDDEFDFDDDDDDDDDDNDFANWPDKHIKV